MSKTDLICITRGCKMQGYAPFFIGIIHFYRYLVLDEINTDIHLASLRCDANGCSTALIGSVNSSKSFIIDNMRTDIRLVNLRRVVEQNYYSQNPHH